MTPFCDRPDAGSLHGGDQRPVSQSRWRATDNMLINSSLPTDNMLGDPKFLDGYLYRNPDMTLHQKKRLI